MNKALHNLYAALLDFFFPRRCPFCDEIAGTEDGICDSCRKKIAYVKEPMCKKCGKPLEHEQREYCYDCNKKKHVYDMGKAVFLYQGMVRQSLHRFKYANRREYAYVYGEQAVRLYGTWLAGSGIEAMIPIPLHRKRRQQRGYNQAELIAREIARRTDIPVRTDILCRSLNTRPQKELNDAQRKKNMKRAFTISPNIVQLKKVVLIDDIYTTGSTVDAAAELLKSAGVQKVYVLCMSIGSGF